MNNAALRDWIAAVKIERARFMRGGYSEARATELAEQHVAAVRKARVAERMESYGTAGL